MVRVEQRRTYPWNALCRQSCSQNGVTELAMPPSITVEMAKGFTLYMVKAVISRADEVIDLAQTNLWR
jgi:hypothetical protein